MGISRLHDYPNPRFKLCLNKVPSSTSKRRTTAWRKISVLCFDPLGLGNYLFRSGSIHGPDMFNIVANQMHRGTTERSFSTFQYA